MKPASIVARFRKLRTNSSAPKEDLVIAQMDFSRSGIQGERLRPAGEELLDRIRHEPGVQDAAQVRNVPIGGSFSNRNIIIEGATRKENVNFNAISDRYFHTMGTALLAGRDFDRRDSPAASRVAIVTESFARVFFGGRNPVGLTFQIDERPGVPRPAYEIVGLAGDAKYTDLRDPFEPLLYVPTTQDDLAPAFPRFVVRSSLPSAGITPSIAGLARAIAPATIVKFRTMASQVNDSLVRERLLAALSGFFGALAALIAMIGLYGVMSYSVARRRNEIGIRMALGADRRAVVGMVMREAATLLAAGLIIGTIAALAAARAAGALLFGLRPHDPTTLVAAAVALALIASLASYLPALHAARLEPTEALREQ